MVPWWFVVLGFMGGSVYGVFLVWAVDAIAKELKHDRHHDHRDG